MNLKRGLLGVVLGLGLAVLVLWGAGRVARLEPVYADRAIGASDQAGIVGAALHPLARSSVIAENAGAFSDLVADSSGRLHVSFQTRSEEGLEYAVYRDSTWYTQTVDQAGWIGRNSIAVDPDDGSPHLSYAKGHELWYAHLRGADWISSAVAAGSRWHKQNAIAVDSRGRPQIAYSEDWQVGGGYWFGNVKHAQWDGAEWIFSTVYTSGEEVQLPVCLVLDGMDRAYVLFKKRFYGGYFGIYRADQVADGWQIERLEHAWYNTFPHGAGLAVDESEELYWTYRWHGQRAAGTALAESILSYSATGMSDIAVDDAGRGYVVYQEGSVLRLAVKAVGNNHWTQMPLVALSEQGTSDISLAVAQGTIHVVYTDQATDQLVHTSLPVSVVTGRLDPLELSRTALVADGNSTCTITATVRGSDEVGLPLPNVSVTLTLDPALGSAFVHSDVGTTVQGVTDMDGIFTATLRAGTHTGVVTVTAAAPDAVSQSAAIELVKTIDVLVDDFASQPISGTTVWYYNRLGGDRGALGAWDGAVEVDWGRGEVTATVLSGGWGGVWTSLNHPLREEKPLNLSRVLPAQIRDPYQSRVTGLTLDVARATPGALFRIELKDKRTDALLWSRETTLSGGPQTLSYSLEPLPETTTLLWLLDQAGRGDTVVVENVSFTATTQITDPAWAGFVWSYGMLLNTWDAETGLVRDKSRDASGEFDAIQSTGSLAAATAVAEQLGVVGRADAISIVTTISDTLLVDVPRHSLSGLWPHWVKLTASDTYTIVHNTEWSSVDTAIAAVGLLEAQVALGLDSSGTERMLREIQWDALVLPSGISHGYTYEDELILHTWDVFGGESWLAGLIYASATGEVAPIKYGRPPTANGSGFIDELAWLFAPPPPTDCWATDWPAYRRRAAEVQATYYVTAPSPCYDDVGLFGLSAAEVPDPSAVAVSEIYQAFGVGGQFSPPNDGSSLLGAPVVIPHYWALIASIYPESATRMWDWLIDEGPMSPLSNVESLLFPADASCVSDNVHWNALKGSWNLSLQTLGWGRYLAERQGKTSVLWKAANSSLFLRAGYERMTMVPVAVVHIQEPVWTRYIAQFSATYEPQNDERPIVLTWDNGTIGSNARYSWSFPGSYTITVTATNRCPVLVTGTRGVENPWGLQYMPLVMKWYSTP